MALLLLLLSVSMSSVYAYTNTRYGFSIEPPSGWAVDDKVSFAAVVFYGPIEEDFRVNVNVQVESTSVSLAQYISSSKTNLETLESYQLLSEAPRTINGVDAYELVLKFSYSGTIVQEKIVALLKDGKAFVVVYAALPTTYQTYLNAFESSVQTFKVEPGLGWWIWAIIVAVIVGVAVAAVFALRRRKRPPIPPPQQPPMPSGP